MGPDLKPPTFSGKKADFAAFSTLFKTYLQAKGWSSALQGEAEDAIEGAVRLSLCQSVTACKDNNMEAYLAVFNAVSAQEGWNALQLVMEDRKGKEQWTAIRRLLNLSYKGSVNFRVSLITAMEEVRASIPEDHSAIDFLNDVVAAWNLSTVDNQEFKIGYQQAQRSSEPTRVGQLLDMLEATNTGTRIRSNRTEQALAGKPMRKLKKHQCPHCNKYGTHKPEECRSRPRHTAKKTSHQALTAGTKSTSKGTMMGTMGTEVRKESHLWGIDSQASLHLTGQRDIIQNLREVPSVKIAGIAGGVQSMHAGTVVIITDQVVLTVKDVYYVPGLPYNLLSAGIIGAKASITMSRDRGAHIKFNDGSMIPLQLKGNTYYIRTTNPDHHRGMAMTMKKIAGPMKCINTWHGRLGHPSYKSTKMTLRECNMQYDGEEEPCSGCLENKSKRKPVAKESDTSDVKHTGEFITMDIIGPFEASFSKQKYAIIILDANTRYADAIFMKSKDEAPEALQKWVRGTHVPVYRGTMLQTDSDPVFKGKSFRDVCIALGLSQRFSPPHTQALNGLVERAIGTIRTSARTMLNSVPHVDGTDTRRLWAYAVKAAVTAYNFRHHTSIGTSPHQALRGRAPPISMIRVFGSVAYIHDEVRGNSTWSPRAREGLYVGYDDTSMSHTILLKGSNIVINSIHVDFVEHTCPISVPVSPRLVAEEEKSMQPPESCEVQDHEISLEVNESEEESPTSQELANRRLINEEPEENEVDVQIEAPYTTRLRPRTAHQGLAAMIGHPEPTSHSQVLRLPEPIKSEWLQAEQREWDNLVRNETFKVINEDEVPKDRTVIPCSILYKVKLDQHLNVKEHKVRIVARGDKQVFGVDYDEVSAPTSMYSSVRIFLTLSASQKFHIHQLDITAAFLHAKVDKPFFMRAPQFADIGPGKVLLVIKSLYGIHQAPHLWNQELDQYLRKIGFMATSVEPCMYFMKDHEVLLIVTVDDFLVSARNLKEIRRIKARLAEKFELKDLGPAKHYLGWVINYDQQTGTLQINQAPAITSILNRFGMADAKPAKTPLPAGTELAKSSIPTTTKPYRALIGCVLHIARCTRPDIAFTVSALSRHCQNPTEEHFKAGLHLLRYLKGTVSLNLSNFGATSLHGFSDATWGTDKETRRSQTGFIFYVSGFPVSWESHLQPTTALSSAEAEYLALTDAVKEGIWISDLLCNFMEIPHFTLHVDNQAAIQIATTKLVKTKTKHFAIRHHFIREVVAEGRVKIIFTPTSQQVADLLTKAPSKSHATLLKKLMGLAEEECDE